jgi:hypothetical protein
MTQSGNPNAPPQASWYSPNYNPAQNLTGTNQPVTQYQNQGNDFLGQMFGVSQTPESVYFGGSPSGAAGATQYYQQMGAQAAQNQAPEAYEGMANAAAAAQGQQAAGAATTAGQQAGAAAGQQTSALSNLADSAQGKGAAAAQLQQGINAGINANMAMANSARGQAGLANAQKNALAQNAQVSQGAINQSQQTQLQAQQAYANAASQAQNQYAQQQMGFGGLNLQGTGQVQQNYMNQAQMQEQQNALNQQGQMGYEQLGFNAQAEGLQAQEANQQSSLSTNQANAKGASSGLGGILGAVGGAMAFLDAKFREPGKGGAAWTIREEPDFLLAKNDRTGELRKILTAPLAPHEKHEALNRPHGAGPIDDKPSPNAGNAFRGAVSADGYHADMPIIGGLMGGGGSSPKAPTMTSPSDATSTSMMNATSPYTSRPIGGSVGYSGGPPQNIGQGISAGIDIYKQIKSIQAAKAAKAAKAAGAPASPTAANNTDAASTANGTNPADPSNPGDPTTAGLNDASTTPDATPDAGGAPDMSDASMGADAGADAGGDMGAAAGLDASAADSDFMLGAM